MKALLVFVSLLMLTSATYAFGPIDCIKAADGLLAPNLTTSEALQLCKGAQNAEPVACVQQAYRLISPALSVQQAIVLCNPSAQLGEDAR